MSASTTTSLRERQADLTRSLIVQAFAELVAQHGPTGFSMQDIADAAGVAIRTLYRYFPSREELWTGLLAQVDAEVDKPSGTVHNWLESRGMLAHNFEVFSRHEPLMRAVVIARFAGTVEAASKRRTEYIKQAVEQADLDLDEQGRAQMGGLLRLLGGATSWARLTDEEIGLDARQAGEAVEWAMHVLIHAARQQKGRLQSVVTGGEDG